MQNLEGVLKYDPLVAIQNPAAGTVNTITGKYRSMAKYRKGLVIVSAHLTNTKICTGQLTMSTAAAATAKANVTGKTITLTGTTAAPDQVGVIPFDVSELDLTNAKIFVGCDLTTDQSGDYAEAILIRSAARYALGETANAAGSWIA